MSGYNVMVELVGERWVVTLNRPTGYVKRTTVSQSDMLKTFRSYTMVMREEVGA